MESTEEIRETGFPSGEVSTTRSLEEGIMTNQDLAMIVAKENKTYSRPFDAQISKLADRQV